MSRFAVTISPRTTIYARVDSGTGYKSYAVPSIIVPAGVPYIRARVLVPSASKRLAVFINGINAVKSFTVTQTGRTVMFESIADFSAFTAPITLSFDIAK